ncbi:MAG: hypothetical protein KGV44_05665 [Flavobacteriaceae bacterium]|nr:hypothetical protein [Flavobacteriaceae bacterium]
MKRVILLLIGFVLFSNVINAQSVKRDVVYLKNGSIIKGEIVEQVPNKTITIQTMDGSTFVCSIEDIIKISKENTGKVEVKYIKKKEKIQEYRPRQNVYTETFNDDKKFNYYSFNIGGGNAVHVNLAEMNFSAQNGFGGIVKVGGGFGIGYLEDSFLLHLAGGPSYSFTAGSTIGTVSLMSGMGLLEYNGRYYEDTITVFLYGVGYTHRFFTNKNWNLLLGADFISGFGGVNIGFAYSW